MEVPFPGSKVVSIAALGPEQPKPLLARESCGLRCNHESATFLVDLVYNRITCSACKEVIEAIEVIKMLLRREWSTSRKESAAAWQRMYAEEEAERQAKKTRKAALATLFRFCVSPATYEEEFRRNEQITRLAERQDGVATLEFPKERNVG